MVKAPLPFQRSKRVLYQCLPLFVKFFVLGYAPVIGFNVRSVFTALYDFSVFGGGAELASRASFAGFGFVLLERVITGFITGLVAGERVAFGTGVGVFLSVVLKVFGVVCRVRCLAGTANGGDGGKGFYIEPVRNAKLTSGMVSFVVERSKLVGLQNGFGAP